MDEVTKRMIDAGLQPAVGPVNSEVLVPVMKDGQQQMVPASEASYYALGNIQAMLQQLMFRLDALHHHLSFRAHAKSQEISTCQMCSAMADAARAAIEELTQDANVVAGDVGVSAGVQGSQEEERETDSE